jgi:acyl-CoA synthetase (AMP-forming)/AMP-acid ligase II
MDDGTGTGAIRQPSAAPADLSDRLHTLVSKQAALRPAAVALWWKDNGTTYAELNHRVRRVGACLAASGAPGERVAVLAWNCPEYVDLIYGTSAAGKILVPLNARLAPAEILYQLRAATVGTLFADPELLSGLPELEDLFPELQVIALGDDYRHWLNSTPAAEPPDTRLTDPAWILFTSGTTGRPKGAVLTQRSLLAGLRSAALGRPVRRDDRYLYPFPLFHVAAHNVLLQHRHGAAVVLLKSFDPTALLTHCRKLQVTTLSLAPTMIAMLLDEPAFNPSDLASVRSIGYGASPMPLTLLRRLLATMDVDLCQSYGMTELAGSIAFLTPADHRLAAADQPGLLASVGKPLPTARVRLAGAEGAEPAGPGEILVSAEQCMSGYWQEGEATAAAIENGWLHTGDVGRFDDSGYLYLVDRKKDMIISGGENIASREVEEVLRQHPAVRECAVIGVHDEHWGESVCAVLDLHGAVGDSVLDTWCRQHLAGYKTPRTWVRGIPIPINAGGKIDKAALRKTVAGAAQSQP